ncbi:hypothetical protein D6783_01130 [Candidatus Woesearchaeota archaeon]|nr:MAG: hypothetical protein D6783_01130 [Candidatus Woesearchaeota archaeon]
MDEHEMEPVLSKRASCVEGVGDSAVEFPFDRLERCLEYLEHKNPGFDKKVLIKRAEIMAENWEAHKSEVELFEEGKRTYELSGTLIDEINSAFKTVNEKIGNALVKSKLDKYLTLTERVKLQFLKKTASARAEQFEAALIQRYSPRVREEYAAMFDERIAFMRQEEAHHRELHAELEAGIDELVGRAESLEAMAESLAVQRQEYAKLIEEAKADIALAEKKGDRAGLSSATKVLQECQRQHRHIGRELYKVTRELESTAHRCSFRRGPKLRHEEREDLAYKICCELEGLKEELFDIWDLYGDDTSASMYKSTLESVQSLSKCMMSLGGDIVGAEEVVRRANREGPLVSPVLPKLAAGEDEDSARKRSGRTDKELLARARKAAETVRSYLT